MIEDTKGRNVFHQIAINHNYKIQKISTVLLQIYIIKDSYI